MTGGSLRFRLLAAAAASIVIALALASLGLVALFERHVERRFAAELESDLRQIIGSLTWSADVITVPTTLADTRFQEPLSGRYWQVSESERVVARSRSLWDGDLKLPEDTLRDVEVHQHTIKGPASATLLAVERAVTLPGPDLSSPLRVAVGVDRQEIISARNAFGRDLLPYMALLAIFLLAATWIQVSIGLRPLQTVRARLADVRAGRSAALGPDFPDEVRPLVAEADLLLEAQEAAIVRARSRAGDLAHGLKTPLTALEADAEELKSKGESELAADISELSQIMRRHVERELARARVGSRASRASDSNLRSIIGGVLSVIRRLPMGSDLTIDVDVPFDLSISMEAQDLTEILGNLIENAAKWATQHIRIQASQEGSVRIIRIEDDGPGIRESDSSMALARGGRLDEQKSGTGLGLAIVQDILDSYNATLQLGRSPLGGLKAEVRVGQVQ